MIVARAHHVSSPHDLGSLHLNVTFNLRLTSVPGPKLPTNYDFLRI
jgi:hypothetical protein